jgi:hypothetical protein
MQKIGTVDDFVTTVIAQITIASSEDEITEYITISLLRLRDHQVNAHLIVRFIGKMLTQLEQIGTPQFETNMVANFKHAKAKLTEIRDNIYSQKNAENI